MDKFTKEKLVAFLRASRETVDDQTALRAKELYPMYENIVGTYQKKGFRCRYKTGGKTYLYKLTCEDQTEQGTYIAENYTPVDAASIWTGIDETHDGTLADPIPAAAGGMDYVYGLYYIEGGTIYLCTRTGCVDGETISLDYLPSALVGHYFEIVTPE